MAGFEVYLNGRVWVSPEVKGRVMSSLRSVCTPVLTGPPEFWMQAYVALKFNHNSSSDGVVLSIGLVQDIAQVTPSAASYMFP
jgi:hypothetical protein